MEINSDNEFSTFRLENYVRPVHYNLLLDLYISDEYYKGTVDIDMTSEQEIPPSTTHIELNSKGLELDSYSVKLMKKEKIVKIGAIIEQDPLEKVTFLLNEDLETDSSYKLHIEFKGDIAVDGNVGLLLRSYTDEGNKTSNYVAANLLPIFARMVFPCFDEPHLKATFNVTLTHAPEMNSLSTMPLLQTNYGLNAKGEKIIWSIFQQTPTISPSSIGIFVSNMESLTSNGVTIRATNRNEAEQISKWPHFEFFNTLMQSLTSVHLQIPLNFVFAPDLHVETFASFGIIYVSSNDLEQKLNVGSVSGSIVANIMKCSESLIVEIAKQVAVQYFGHMITPKWWTDIWLSESLSQYYGLRMACKLDNKDRTYKDLIPSMLRNQVFDESSGNSRVLAENVNSSTQVIQSSSRSRTNKGVSLLFLVSDILGESIFLQAVSSFLKKFFLGSATTQDLMKEWENQLKLNNITLPNNLILEKILQPWLESNDEPIVNVQRIHEPTYSTLIISQIHPPKLIHNVDWYIQLHYISSRDTAYTTKPTELWLGPHMEDGKMSYEITIQSASGVNDWIIFNPKGSGLYRVTYDPISWELLINQLKRNLTEIPTTARSQLIADAFSLARDGTGHYSNALELAEYLADETSFLPWNSAFKAFEELEIRLYRNKGLYNSFQTYLRNMVQLLYQKLGFETNNKSRTSDEDDYLKVLLRSKTIEWACKYEVEDCIEKATSTVKQILAENITKIQDEYMEAILCGGLSQADAHTWNEAYNHLIHASRSKKSIILGLGCSRDPHLIESYLNKTLTGDMSSEYVIDAFNGIYRRHYNYEKALNFLEINIGSIQDKYDNETLSELLIGISRYATRIHHFKQIKGISSRIDGNEDLMLALHQTHKPVQEMENWMIINGKNLREYFNKKNTEREFSTARSNGGNILMLGFLVLYSIT